MEKYTAKLQYNVLEMNWKTFPARLEEEIEMRNNVFCVFWLDRRNVRSRAHISNHKQTQLIGEKDPKYIYQKKWFL